MKTLSRQRLHQLARIAAGLCVYCETPRVTGTFCEKHRLKCNVYNLARIKRRLRRGICVQCQRQRVNRTHCEIHRSIFNTYQRAYYRR